MKKLFNFNNKKLLSILLIVSILFSIVGCSKPNTTNTNNANQAKKTSEQAKSNNEDLYLKGLENYKYNDWYTEDYGIKNTEDRGAKGKEGVVSSQRYEASEIGMEILKNGGNAVDAAVATAFALGVCEPNASGLGGGGFMTLRDAKTGEVKFIDFREVAPVKATEDMYPIDKDGNVTDESKIRGGLAVAVPGEVAGLLHILDKYGSMSREEVIQPAIDLANEGFIVTPKSEGTFNDAYKLMQDYSELGKLYLRDDLPLTRGNIVKNPDLAKTLGIIAKEGKDGFYKGDVAQAIVDAVQEAGGILTLEDLENYQVNEYEPVQGTYKGYKIYSSPTPSSGGTHLIQILNILENFDLENMEPYSTEYMHLFSEVFKIVYADRAEYMGDPKYVDVPINGLTSKDYAKKLAEKIDLEKSNEWEADDPWKYEGNSTSHLSVADKDGNMVGITKTINYYFGSGVVPKGYGFILNNEMDDFSPVPGGPNSVQPGKKPLSSMSPTIIENSDGSPFMVLGAPGGSSIFAQLSQVISHVVDKNMDIQEAINEPRVLDNLDNKLIYMDGVDENEAKKLEEMGHETSHTINDAFGFVQAVQYMEDGTLQGGADPYSDAKAVGY